MSDLRAGMPTYTEDRPATSQVDVKASRSLSQYKKMFDDSRWLCNDAREDSQLSRDYYDGYQLTAAERATLEGRKQPPVVNNRLQRAIDGILGVVQQSRTDPRALMRNPPDDAPQAPLQPGNAGPQMGQQPGQPPQLDAGDVASMTLRFIADTTHFDALKMDVLENGIIEGCGAAIVEMAGEDVIITQIRWEEFFYDPYSKRADFKDARYMGTAKWMYADDLAAMYPAAKAKIDQSNNTGILGGAVDSTWQDRPENGQGGNPSFPWVDSVKKRLMVVELYSRTADGNWERCVFYAGDILEADVSPYLDDKGNPTCPIEGWTAYIDRNNNRYGLVRTMRDIQDEINKRRSKALHEINTRQVQNTDANAPPVDANTVRTEAAKPDGVIPQGWQVVPRSDVVANNMEMLAEAKGELERMAAAPAILGRQGADASGRSVQLRQQAGMTELARVLGRHTDWQHRMYSQMWGRARQFYTGPKWIRVTNDVDAPQYIRINEPGPAVQGPVDPRTGVPSVVPGPPKNHIAKMDVDIVLDDVPNTATLQQEIFEAITELVKVYGPQQVPFELVLEASGIPEKRKLITKLRQFQAQQAPAQQQAAAAAQAEQEAKTQKLQSEAANNQADNAETMADVKLKGAQAALIEVQTVAEASVAHMRVDADAQLPPGYVLDGSGKPVPIVPPTISTGADSMQPQG